MQKTIEINEWHGHAVVENGSVDIMRITTRDPQFHG